MVAEGMGAEIRVVVALEHHVDAVFVEDGDPGVAEDGALAVRVPA